MKTSLTARRSCGVAPAGREHAGEVAHGGDDVGLVERARPAHEVAERAPSAVSTKRAKRSAVSGSSQPPWLATQRGVVKWWKVTIGVMPLLVARRAHPAVVVERGPRELALLGLDAAPLDREAVGAEPEVGQQRDVVAGSGGSGRRRRRSARRTATLGCAPTPTSRCSSCRPRPGARRWPCPRGTRRGTRFASVVEAGEVVGTARWISLGVAESTRPTAT